VSCASVSYHHFKYVYYNGNAILHQLIHLLFNTTVSELFQQ